MLPSLCVLSRILTAGEARVHALLKSKEEELHRVSVCQRRVVGHLLTFDCLAAWVSINAFRMKLAAALVEHETLDAEEVRKVIKGEQIRNIAEVIQEDLSRMALEEKS